VRRGGPFGAKRRRRRGGDARIPGGPGRDRLRRPDPLRVGAPGGGPPRSPLPHLEEPVHPRLAGRVGGRPEKGISPAGETPGILPEPIRVRRCRNRCIFCFVHQLPQGLRRTLYVKDEDVRLSFLHGQYVTFSDLSEEEAAKIVRYRLSPLYVSIHTTDPQLRRRMLGNPRAADVMRVMRRLIRAGIVLHGQIVVCPGVNDGAELARTLRQLSGLRPGLRTVAVVPVGLTSIGPDCRRCARSRAARRGRRSTCSARWERRSGKARTASRSRSPPTNIS